MFPGASLIVTLINLFILVLIVRAIFSWFPGMLYSEAGRIIVMATEWYLGPIRRVIPAAGGLDISFLVGIIILYALAAFIGSGGVEIPQTHKTQTIGAAVGFQRMFEGQFGSAVRIDWIPECVFGDRDFRLIAVDRATRRKDEVGNLSVCNGVQQRQRSGYVIIEIFAWILYGFAYISVRSEMHDRIDAIHSCE